MRRRLRKFAANLRTSAGGNTGRTREGRTGTPPLPEPSAPAIAARRRRLDLLEQGFSLAELDRFDYLREASEDTIVEDVQADLLATVADLLGPQLPHDELERGQLPDGRLAVSLRGDPRLWYFHREEDGRVMLIETSHARCRKLDATNGETLEELWLVQRQEAELN